MIDNIEKQKRKNKKYKQNRIKIAEKKGIKIIKQENKNINLRFR